MQTCRKPIRTLVVDDSPAALNSICLFLRLQANIRVVGTAVDGCGALDSAHALRPELVLMDVQMPKMNGIDATSQLIRDLPSTHVIMVTVHDSPEVRQACRASGADGFIAKEHLDEELPAMLQKIFSPE